MLPCKHDFVNASFRNLFVKQAHMDKKRGQLEQNMILHVEPSLRYANIMWIKTNPY